jgi:hypothetical protein
MRAFKRLTYLLIFLSLPTLGCAQYWRTFIDPIYKAHWHLNENQPHKSIPVLVKRSTTKDTLHPIYWHSLTRIYQDSTPTIQSIQYARKAVLTMVKLQNDTKKFEEFRKIYFFDAYYLDLYYRKLLYDKFESERSYTSTVSNNELLGFFLEESQTILPYVDLQNINRRITFPQITEHITKLNDTIEFYRIMNFKSTSKLWNYLNQLGQNETQINLLPNHLKSFYKEAKDSFYSWTFEIASQKHTEKAYLEFATTYPDAPQSPIALQYADDLAFSFCRTQHTAEHYEKYLRNYPYGKYKKQAKLLLRYLVVVPVPFARGDGKYVFVDSINMRPWIDSAYDFAYPFCLKHHKQWNTNAATLISGCALVMKKDEFERNQWFYIEKDGTPYNDKIYDEIKQISKNKALITKSNHHGIIDQHGRELLPPIFKKIHYDTFNQIAMVFNGEFWALFNAYGKRLTKFEYLPLYQKNTSYDFETLRFYDNRIIVQKENMPVLIDFEGNPYFLGSFSHVEPFVNGLAVATLPNKKQLLIDTQGKAKSDTFTSVEAWIPGTYYKVETEDKKLKYSLIRANTYSKNYTYKIKSEKPIEGAWYFNKPLFLSESNGESKIFNEDDSLLFTAKGLDIKVHAHEIFIQHVRKNPKTKTGPWVKKWFNPALKNFSQIAVDEIAVLSEDRLVLYDNKKAKLVHINETEIPIFQEDKPLPEIHSIKEIFVNRENTFIVRTDSTEALINKDGLVLIPFDKGSLEEYTHNLITRNKDGNAYLLNYQNKNILGPFEEINEEGFEGYFLIKQEDRWVWVDTKKRLFGETR